MTATSLEISAPRAAVFAAIIDPLTYPEWLLGARTIRDVDDGWPRPGTAFRHVIGFPPVLIPGSSTSRRVVPDELFELGAGMGPLGEARVRFSLRDASSGGTVVEVDEQFVAGPAGWSWRFARPAVAALIWGRNAMSLESLQRHISGGEVDGGHEHDGAVDLRSDRSREER